MKKILSAALLALAFKGALAAPPSPGAPPFNALNLPQNVYNLSPQFLPYTRSAFSAISKQTGNMCILFEGDSTTAGAPVGGLFANSKSYDFAQWLSGQFPAGEVSTDSIWLPQLESLGSDIVDSRVTVGSGWAGNGLGSPLAINSSTTSPISFAPTGQVNSFDVWYHDGTGSFTIQIDSGTPTTVTETNTGGMLKATISTGTVGTHTLNVAWVSGTAYLGLLRGYNNTIDQISVINMGLPSATTANWYGTGSSASANIQAAALGCATNIFNITINDDAQGLSLSSAQSHMQYFISQILALPADMILEVPNPIYGYTPATIASQLAYRSMIIGLGQTNNIPVDDIYYDFNGYTAAAALGFMQTPAGGQAAHPSAQGYADIARLEQNLFSASVGSTGTPQSASSAVTVTLFGTTLSVTGANTSVLSSGTINTLSAGSFTVTGAGTINLAGALNDTSTSTNAFSGSINDSGNFNVGGASVPNTGIYRPGGTCGSSSLGFASGSLGVSAGCIDGHDNWWIDEAGAPTVTSGCGTGYAISGVNQSFTITMGTGTFNSCVLAFANSGFYITPRATIAGAANATAAPMMSSIYIPPPSTTSITIDTTGTTMAGAEISVHVF
jgi:hypothetical protein